MVRDASSRPVGGERYEVARKALDIAARRLLRFVAEDCSLPRAHVWAALAAPSEGGGQAWRVASTSSMTAPLAAELVVGEVLRRTSGAPGEAVGDAFVRGLRHAARGGFALPALALRGSAASSLEDVAHAAVAWLHVREELREVSALGTVPEDLSERFRAATDRLEARARDVSLVRSPPPESPS